MTTLKDLWSTYNYRTDKGDCTLPGGWPNGPPCKRCAVGGHNTGHHYLEFYDMLFGPRRETAKHVVDIGIYHGGSTKLFHDYFPMARITGIDVKLYPQAVAFCKGLERISLVQASSTDPAAMAQALQPPPDIVVDDGSHKYPDQLATLQTVYPLVAPGGLYCVEDLSPGAVKPMYDAIKAFQPDAIFMSDTTTRGGIFNSVVIAAVKPVN